MASVYETILVPDQPVTLTSVSTPEVYETILVANDTSTTAVLGTEVILITTLAGPPGNPGPPMQVQDEGTDLTLRSRINFTGVGIAATDDPGNGRINVNVQGGGAVQDEGVALPQRLAINFIGGGATATDDSVNNRTNVTIPAPEVTQAELDAEATARTAGDTNAHAELIAHEGDTIGVHGIADTSLLATDADVASAVALHEAAVDPHPQYLTTAEGNAAYEVLGAASTVSGDLAAHLNDTTDAHDASSVSFVPVGTVGSTDVQAAIAEVSGDVTAEASTRASADTTLQTNITNEATARASADTTLQSNIDAHLADTTDAHDASAISFVPAGSIAATDVQAAIEEVATEYIAADAAEVTARNSAIATAIANLINSAPGALDTLNELATALGNDPNFATTVTNALAGKQPLDSDLTAIAALATTAFGRGLLVLANAAALQAAAGTVIGTDVQAHDADLDSIAALATTAYGRAFLVLADAAAGRTALALGTAATSASTDFQPIDTDLTSIAALSTTSYGRAFLALVDAAAGRTALGLGDSATHPASDFQSSDAELTALAGLTSAANKLPYFTGSGTALLTDLTAFIRTLLDDVDASAARGTLGLGSAATSASTDFQPIDATLTALAGLATGANKLPYSNGTDTFTQTDLTAFIRTLLDDADAAAARGTLGLGTAATVDTGTTSGTVALLSTGGRYDIARLASGTPDGTKFVRDDGTLVVPTAGSSTTPRHTVTITTASIANNALDTTHPFTLAKTHRIISYSVDRLCEFRIYASAAIQTADSTRTDGTVIPTPDQAPILQATPSVASTVYQCNPMAHGASLESTPGTSFPVRVKNLGTTGTVTITLVVEDIE